jgi:hypothetical protein
MQIPRQTAAGGLPAGIEEGIPDEGDSTWGNAPRSILQSALAALSDGRISEAVAQFDDGFNFNDHALALEFTDKLRLTEFFQKTRELFPDTTLLSWQMRIVRGVRMSVTKTSTSSELTVAHELRAAPQEHPTVFQARFSRCYRLLHFIACRVLGGPERADEAVENCWLRASRNPLHFEYEGAFRSWLVRVLIDEALAIRPEHQETVNPRVLRERRSGILRVDYQTAG